MSPQNPLFPVYAQAFRCGHIDGRKRCGVYVLGEERCDSFDIANDHERSMGRWGRENVGAFQMGYEAGYRCGASGDACPADVESAVLP